jgi:hypothetical protein
MTAIACLRIVVGDRLQFTDTDTLADLVSKVAAAYLETRWSWPRRHGLVAPFAFVLADPRAIQLDPRELQVLAAELHVRLFGDEGDGAVSLLTFEGDQRAVMQFAGANDKDLRAFLRGETDKFGAGRLCRITPDEVVSLHPAGGPVTGNPSYEALATEEVASRLAFRGVYDSRKETFIGSVAVWQEARADQFYASDDPASINAADLIDRDLKVVKAATEAAVDVDQTRLFIPISFSTLVKPSARKSLALIFEPLPARIRRRLVAVIYETPRSPSFQALTQVRKFLEPHVGSLGLQVADPDFQIDSLPPNLATSVTLSLPATDENVRLQAIGRFLRQSSAYARKRVLQGVDNLRTRRELQACLKHGAPYLTGPAISVTLDRPLTPRPCPAFNLPLHDWSPLEATADLKGRPTDAPHKVGPEPLSPAPANPPR